MMFERLASKVQRSAALKVRERIDALAETVRADLPRGVEVEKIREGLVLKGRGLARRFAIEASLRWLRLG